MNIIDNDKPIKVGVLGAGTWGIALARLLTLNGHDVTVWSAIEEEIVLLSLQRRHPKLPEIVIPENIRFTKDIKEAVNGSDIILIAVPSPYVRSTVTKMKPFFSCEQIIVNVAKGLEADTLYTLTEVIRDEMQKGGELIPSLKIVALSGPTHAEEVAIDMPTSIVSACDDMNTAKVIQNIFSSSCMRTYTNTDIKGVEICGALKNIIALAVGVASGLGYGDNTRAALITRGMAEITQLGIAMGGMEQTFSGLAGIGDMIVTATSSHSRNNRTGILIGQGVEPKEAVKSIGMVVEGINALPAALKLAKLYNVEVPIIEAVDLIINQGASPLEISQQLMTREYKAEISKSQLEIRFESAMLRKEKSNKIEPNTNKS